MSDTISAKSLVYRIAFCLDSRKPVHVKICTLFWKFVLNLVVMIPLVSLIFFVGSIAFTVLGALFAHRYLWKNEQGNTTWFVPYTHWIKIGGRRVWPIWLLALPGLYGLKLIAVEVWDKIWPQFVILQHNVGSHDILFLTFVLISSALAIGTIYYFHSETHRQLSQSFKIWWDNKVCPTIDVTDLPPEKTMTVEEETALG